MRTLEILIVALIGLWLMTPALTRSKGIKQGVGLIVAVTVPWQVTIEGYRWQMVPAYFLAAAIAFVTWWDFIGPPDEFRAPRGSLAIGRSLAVIGAVVAVALPVVFPVPRLPTPGGAMEVGTFSLHLVDPNRSEIYGDLPGGPRELMVQVFYPAAPGPDAETGPWVQDLGAVGDALARDVELPSFAFDHLALTSTHTYPHAPVSDAAPSFPVVVYSHGWRSFRTANFNQAESLASEGFVVVTVDHSHASVMTVFPGDRRVGLDPGALPSEDDVGKTSHLAAANQLIDVMAADLEFVIDELEGINRGERSTALAQRLDLDRLGLFGHSTGGGAVVSFCASDDRCRAGLGFDPWVEPLSEAIIDRGLDVPFAFVRSEAWTRKDNEGVLRRLRENGGSDQSWQAIAGTEHRDFLFSPLMSPVGDLLGIQGSIDSGRLIDILDETLTGFFGKHLQGRDTGFPGMMEAEFAELAPEVVEES